MYRAAWAGIVGAGVLAAVIGTTEARRRSSVPLGSWGGRHVAMEVKAGGASLDFDCAHGRITEPLVLDGQGRFDLRGTYAQERGGPQREGEENDGQPARYAGRLEGKILTLTVKVGSANDAVGSFTLRHGETPRVTKCL